MNATRNITKPTGLQWVSLILLLASWMVIAFSAFAGTADYGYDNVSRLTRVQYDSGQSVRYVYDNLGNRLQELVLASAATNNPPGTVTPTPSSGATNIGTSVVLKWSTAVDPDPGDQVVYYLYLGTEANPPLVYSGWNREYTPPAPLSPLTTYNWKIIARDSSNAETTSGPWTFTTSNEPPRAVINANRTDAIIPYTATLTDASISNDDAIASRAWDFNDNGTVNSTAPQVNFTVSTGRRLPHPAHRHRCARRVQFHGHHLVWPHRQRRRRHPRRHR